MTMSAPPGPTTSNMYRVGDYVFFETSAAGPYAVRRIEELNKTPGGKSYSILYLYGCKFMQKSSTGPGPHITLISSTIVQGKVGTISS